MQHVSGEEVFNATEKGDVTLLRALLFKDPSNVNWKRKADGFTPLFIAASNGHLETMEALLHAGADVNLGNYSGSTPIVGAIWHDRVAALKLLLDAGADVSLAGNTGATPLIWAVWYRRHEMVKILLNAGADPTRTSSENKTALDWASQAPQLAETAKLLEDAAKKRWNEKAAAEQSTARSQVPSSQPPPTTQALPSLAVNSQAAQDPPLCTPPQCARLVLSALLSLPRLSAEQKRMLEEAQQWGDADLASLCQRLLADVTGNGLY